MPLVIPDQTLKSAGLSEAEMQLEIACRLFDAGKLRLWPAAQLAGLSRGEFEEELMMREIPVYRLTPEDWEVDKQTIAELEKEIMSVVVSDSSPIRALAHLNLLPLLCELYGEVFIPSAVLREVTRGGKVLRTLTAEELAQFQVRDPATAIYLPLEFDELDAGERDAIRLAIEISADGLLIDESLGRRVATQLGLRITGTLGILSQAKHRRLIPAVGPLLERLQTEVTFFLAPALKRTVLTDLGEWPPVT